MDVHSELDEGVSVGNESSKQVQFQLLVKRQNGAFVECVWQPGLECGMTC